MKQEEYRALVQAAREADLVDYFRRNGFTVERKGGEYYVKEYPSLCIKPSTNQWFFHYTREGATNNSINCLTKVLGMDFNQAVLQDAVWSCSGKRAGISHALERDVHAGSRAAVAHAAEIQTAANSAPDLDWY